MIEEDCENPGEDKGKFIFCHQFGISEPDIVVLYNDPDECKRYLEVGGVKDCYVERIEFGC